jgi:hypothetical protein
MSKTEDAKKISKKEARKMVYDKLAGALAEYKDVVKEKRFTTNLKKASKLFAADIAKASNKMNGQPRKKRKHAENNGEIQLEQHLAE